VCVYDKFVVNLYKESNMHESVGFRLIYDKKSIKKVF